MRKSGKTNESFRGVVPFTEGCGTISPWRKAGKAVYHTPRSPRPITYSLVVWRIGGSAVFKKKGIF
jgi:hypothetical protein